MRLNAFLHVLMIWLLLSMWGPKFALQKLDRGTRIASGRRPKKNPPTKLRRAWYGQSSFKSSNQSRKACHSFFGDVRSILCQGFLALDLPQNSTHHITIATSASHASVTCKLHQTKRRTEFSSYTSTQTYFTSQYQPKTQAYLNLKPTVCQLRTYPTWTQTYRISTQTNLVPTLYQLQEYLSKPPAAQHCDPELAACSFSASTSTSSAGIEGSWSRRRNSPEVPETKMEWHMVPQAFTGIVYGP